MLPDKISTGPETTSDDRALNVIHDAFDAGRVVRYTGSVERFRGAEVTAMARCEFYGERGSECCHRQQAVVMVRLGDERTQLRHVAAFHLVVDVAPLPLGVPATRANIVAWEQSQGVASA